VDFDGNIHTFMTESKGKFFGTFLLEVKLWMNANTMDECNG